MNEIALKDEATLPMPLTTTERHSLTLCEKMIAEGLQTFYDVGRALITIRQQKLYRATHHTFEEYCREKWGISRPHAYHMIDAANVAENLSQFGDKLPTNEAQTRALSKLEPDQQQTVWSKAVETAPGGKVTAKHIAQTIQQTVPPRQTIIHDIDIGEPDEPAAEPCPGSIAEYIKYSDGEPSSVTPVEMRYDVLGYTVWAYPGSEPPKFKACVAIQSNQPGTAFSWKAYEMLVDRYPTDADIQNIAARGLKMTLRDATKTFPIPASTVYEAF